MTDIISIEYEIFRHDNRKQTNSIKWGREFGPPPTRQITHAIIHIWQTNTNTVIRPIRAFMQIVGAHTEKAINAAQWLIE